MRIRHAALFLALAAAASCAPRARPLVGSPVPAALPDTRLTGAQRIVFRWEFEDGTLVARGEGLARIAAPDSVRLDLFVDGGMGGGTTVLIGDSLSAPGGAMVRRLLPPPPLLWAALGRLAVPPAADTVARRDGELLRADIGAGTVYRATFAGDALRRLERIDDGRMHEWIARPDSQRVEYRHEASGRSLKLTITRADSVERFDAEIWQR
ncbi:MAG TPA: hypothetical protein VFX39_10555 [Gemmatimonadaceae bacterium]|nr:hypothetical protein [Gemmatimonadaceae bacterium]